jgi:predicted nucleic acid-binding Zn ribbon protein
VPHSKGFAHRKERRSGEPVPLGEVVDDLLAEEVFARGMPVAKLARRWPSVVGERLGEATKPTSLEAGVLVVRAADGPWGAQARYLAEEIRKRADEALGGGVIHTVRVVVGTGPSDPRNRR